MTQIASQAPSGPQRMFFVTPTCPERLSEIFLKSKVRAQNLFSYCIALQAEKTRFERNVGS